MADSYVCSGAMVKCTMGTCPARLTVLPTRTVFLAGQPMANISDHISMVNLAPFGSCRSLGFPSTAAATAAAHGVLTPMPCMHNTPAPWMGGKMDYLIKGQPALLKSCTCQCMWGGTITLINNGQVGEGAQGVDKSVIDSISNSINKIRLKWKKRQYIKKINKEKYEYNPEPIDVDLSQDLQNELVSLNAVEQLSQGTLDERIDFVENTLVPRIFDTMDLDPNVSFNWYQDNKTLGYYSENDRSLNINENVLQSTDSRQVNILINTIIHECKHARQLDELTGRSNHGYSEETKQRWLENWNNYISPDESDEGYMKQPIELDAWEFADSVIPDGLLESFKTNHNIS